MKILWISDCPDNKINTGYATATRLIACELIKRGHTFIFGSQCSQDADIQTITVGPNVCKSYGFGKGKFLSAQAIGEINMMEKPDLIVTMADWQMVEGMMGLSGCDAFSKWICYAPIDGDMFTTAWDFMIHETPFMVFMSPWFGPRAAKRRRFGLNAYVPLPLDLGQHFMMDDDTRNTLRKNCKQGAGWPTDTLTVLTVARNQWRKNYPEIIRAASILKKSHPGKFSFVFHCQPTETMGWDLPRLMHYYDVGDCTAISSNFVDTDGKNNLYNSADLFLLPSLGEGFGIPIIEAALYDLPIFTTNDTAGKDLTELIGCDKQNLDFDIDWQHGPTIPRPRVRGEAIAAALINYLENGVSYDLAGARRKTEALFNINAVADTWEKILLDAKSHRDAQFGVDSPFTTSGALEVSLT
jgi:glycosyltransferase involved in cell wall biosynthesis